MLNFKSGDVLIPIIAFNAGLSPCAGTSFFASLNAQYSLNTQFCEHFEMNSISALFIKKSKLKIKLFKFFNGTIIFTFSNSALLPLGNN